MPPNEKVCRVQLHPTSHEYQDVLGKFRATAGGINVLKIERVQNPLLYRSYMVQKQEMDKHCSNSERQLFHGTDGNNINAINTQGLNRSLSGTHGECYCNSFEKEVEVLGVGYSRGREIQ